MKCVPKVLGMIKEEKKEGKNIYIVVKKISHSYVQ